MIKKQTPQIAECQAEKAPRGEQDVLLYAGSQWHEVTMVKLEEPANWEWLATLGGCGSYMHSKRYMDYDGLPGAAFSTGARGDGRRPLQTLQRPADEPIQRIEVTYQYSRTLGDRTVFAPLAKVPLQVLEENSWAGWDAGWLLTYIAVYQLVLFPTR